MGAHKPCPECSAAILADSVSCRCGWQANGQAKPANAPASCAFNEHGHACQHRGIHSFGTAGGGPWYCREHFDRVQGREPEVMGDELPVRSRSLAVREWHAAMAAHRAAQASGRVEREEVRNEIARAAIAREPGEDAEEAAAWAR
jgi:hypothetical protein